MEKFNKIKNIIGTGFNFLISISLIVSGLLKLIGLEEYVNMIDNLNPNYSSNIYLLGIIAIVSGVLFIIPRMFAYGFIASLVFLSGTISAHMQHGDNFLPQVIFVLLTVLVAHIKKPEWFKYKSRVA